MPPWDKYAAHEKGPWQKYGQAPAETAPQPSEELRPADVFRVAPAKPEGIESWLGDLEKDVTEGGNRTFPGRVLGHMQGRGDEGYSGVNSGVSPGVAQIMGSPLTGAVHALQGAASSYHHPFTGPLKAIGGVGEAMTLPSIFAAGPVAREAEAAVPSAERAGRMFNTIENEAADIPVEMKETEPALEVFQKHVKTGGKNSPPIQMLRKRISPTMPRVPLPEAMQADLSGVPARTVNRSPIKFPEARDFYSNVTDVSKRPSVFKMAIESSREPKLRMEAGTVRNALNTDLTNAAETIGRGKDYTDALREYRQAKQLRKLRNGALLLGAGEAARRTGLLGNWIHRTALQQ